jgi:hypothetical protein
MLSQTIMYKKILIMSMLLSSTIFAHNLPEEKLKAAQEKHYLESEEAKSDLKLAALALVAIPVFIYAHEIIMWPLGLHSILINNLGNPPCDQIIHREMVFVGTGFATYSAYKAIIGLKHYIWPDYPKPEDEND